MRSVVIVLFDPASDAGPRLVQASILRRPDFLFLQAAVEPFDAAVALRVMIRGAAMRDAQPVQGLDEPGRSELCAIVRGQNQLALATPGRQSVEHSLFH